MCSDDKRRSAIFNKVLLCGWWFAFVTLVNVPESLAHHCDPCNRIDGPLVPEPCDEWQCISGDNRSDGDIAFSFNAVAGTTYIFSFCEAGGTANFDTGLSTWDSTCSNTRYVCNDDSCGLQSRLAWVAVSTGQFVIKIGAFGSSRGDYTLCYRAVGGACEDTGALDIKPGSCPNPLNRKSKGKLPIALLGTDDFDVLEIDYATLQLSREDEVGGGVAPLEGPPGPHTVFADAGTPFDGELCDCHELEGDGILDLLMKFSTPDVVDVLELDALEAGTFVTLVVSGQLQDGTAFSASDFIKLVPPGDLDSDLDVDAIDFSMFATCFNKAGNSPRSDCPNGMADLDNDGDVDGVDFGVFASCFNKAGNPPRCE